MSSLLTLSGLDLKQQTNNLVKQIEATPTNFSDQDSNNQFKEVYDVLHNLSSMDASRIFYLSNPWSWFTKMDNKLSRYFSQHVFGGIVFPAFECKINDKLLDEINSPVQPKYFAKKIQAIAHALRLRSNLAELMQSTSFTTNQVEIRFRQLVEQVFEEKLPDSFYQDSTLYFDAIRNQHFTSIADPANKSALCEIEPLDREALWLSIQSMLNSYQQKIVDKVAFPSGLYAKLTEAQSLPAFITWQAKSNDMYDTLQSLNSWSLHLQEEWLSGHSVNNSCHQLSLDLDILANELNIADRSFAQEYRNQCEATVYQQLTSDNNQSMRKLYYGNDQEFAFTQNYKSLLTKLNNLSALSFIHTAEPKQFNENESNFFWSIEELSNALNAFQEYEVYAKEHFKSLGLPNKADGNQQNYLAQSIALKQLKLNMLTVISDARVKHLARSTTTQLRAANQKETQLQAYLGNFQESANIILALNDKFQLLGFSDGQHWLKKIANNHAFNLVYRVETLFQESRLYKPLPNPNWGQHNYVKALFGINNEDQLKDYLAAQSDRISYIAANYAEPLISFIRATKGASIDYQLFNKWEKTLIEINKQADKNPANSQSELEHFFNNQLFAINQSNCFQQTAELTAPRENNIYSISQNNITWLAKNHCQSFRADMIAKEYAEVNKRFFNTLAGKFPFSAQPAVGAVSPAAIKAFIAEYPGSSSGLAKRMEVLAWKRNEYKEALEFVKSLDASIDFFNYLFEDTVNSQGIEIVTEFNVPAKQANHVEHIGNWQFLSGKMLAVYPGEEASIYWSPDDEIKVVLRWATNSPFSAVAINGTTQSNQLEFKKQGIWSLLSFIWQHRSDVYDDRSLISESVLLEFSAGLTSRKSSSQPQEVSDAKAFMRLTLWGTDPETKQKIPITIPQSFPEYAPEVPQGF